MSQIRWCDAGKHAFSLNDPDRKEYAETSVGDGQRRTHIDICGPCDKGNVLGIKDSLNTSPATEKVAIDATEVADK